MKFDSDALSPTRRMVTWQGEDLVTSTHVGGENFANQPTIFDRATFLFRQRSTTEVPNRHCKCSPSRRTRTSSQVHQRDRKKPSTSLPRHNPLLCLPSKKEQSLPRTLYTRDDGNADDATTTATTMSTQSGDDAQRPTAVAKVYLEDGTVLIGRSFGAHKSVEGEVRSGLEETTARIQHVRSWFSLTLTRIFRLCRVSFNRSSSRREWSDTRKA
jgi:hypothetical protein